MYRSKKIYKYNIS